ncbi:MAG: hypothetical protein U0487_03460 [Patescibacteria group bacterium]
MWILGIVAAVIVMVFAMVISKYGDTLLDSEQTFKVFVGGFFAVLLVAGVVMKFTLPGVQGEASIGSLKEAIVHPAFAFQE